MLFQEINEKHRQLKREQAEAEENLKHVTWLKRTVVKCIINDYLRNDMKRKCKIFDGKNE